MHLLLSVSRTSARVVGVLRIDCFCSGTKTVHRPSRVSHPESERSCEVLFVIHQQGGDDSRRLVNNGHIMY